MSRSPSRTCSSSRARSTLRRAFSARSSGSSWLPAREARDAPRFASAPAGSHSAQRITATRPRAEISTDSARRRPMVRGEIASITSAMNPAITRVASSGSAHPSPGRSSACAEKQIAAIAVTMTVSPSTRPRETEARVRPESACWWRTRSRAAAGWSATAFSSVPRLTASWAASTAVSTAETIPPTSASGTSTSRARLSALTGALLGSTDAGRGPHRAGPTGWCSERRGAREVDQAGTSRLRRSAARRGR